MKKISKKWKRILPAVLLVLALAFLAGCGGETKPAGDTMVYGSQDYTAINPALYEHGEINLLIFAGLTAHDADNNVVPGLAEKWSYDKGAKTWTFRLRKNLTFHDGEPLTSADVKFTLESILDEKNGSEIVSNYADIKKISCPDARTVKIQLKEENVGFPEYMTIGILPKHLLEGKDLTTDEFNQKPVGAGPYKLTEWDEGQSITLERFDDDGCDVFCRRGIHEDFLQGIHVKFQGFVIAQACRFAVEIRKFSTVYAVRERPHAAGVGFLSRHGHGHERAPVEGTGEDDDIRPFRISFGDFDGVFVGFGAAVDEEGPFLFTSDRGDGIELFRQGDIAFVGDDIGHGVEIVTGLVLDGLDDFRLGIADVQDADAADPVEEIVAVHVFEHSAFASFDYCFVSSSDTVRNSLCSSVHDFLAFWSRKCAGYDFR